MKTIEQSLKSVFAKDSIIAIYKLLIISIGILVVFMSMPIGLYFSINYVGEGLLGGLSFCLFLLIFGFGGIMGSMKLFYYPINLIQSLYNRGMSIIKLGDTEKERISNSFEILESIDTLYDSIRRFNRMKNVMKFFLTRQTNRALDIYSEIISINALLLIRDLQDDLAEDIESRKAKLQESKSEISTHIQGTDVLNQVSELQRARLDRQIEQFEELQRVMVKV